MPDDIQFLLRIMLIAAIIIYLGVTVLVGFLAGRRVKNSEDFLLAGRQLPVFLAASALFATWFGSEAVIGSSARFAEGGVIAVIEDPFGAALSLILIGFFFARKFHSLRILTLGDFYRDSFGKKAEFLAALFLVPSYFAWVAAQFVAMAIILKTLTGLPLVAGMAASFAIVVAYTFVGGMWAVSITDFMQSIFIIVGLALAAVELTPLAGGFTKVVSSQPAGFYDFLPAWNRKEVLAYLAAWFTIGLGSLTSQDVFQRVMSSKDQKTAVKSSFIAAALYLSIALIPLYIGLCAKAIGIFHQVGDKQFALPQLILQKTHLFTQILFFGALFSALLSTASGAILAPAAIVSENLVLPRMKQPDPGFSLKLNRYSVLGIGILSFVYGLFKADVYELVSESSAMALVSLFWPMMAGMYRKKTGQTAALVSMVTGFLGWLFWKFHPVAELPAVIAGMAFSLAGLILAELAWMVRRPTVEKV